MRKLLLLGLVACSGTDYAHPPSDGAPGVTIHANAEAGDDINDGIAQPVKTLRHALELARANPAVTTIELAGGDGGLYDVIKNGETFPYDVLTGLTIESPGPAMAAVSGTGTQAGLMVDRAVFSNIAFVEFTTALTVTESVKMTNGIIDGDIGIRTDVTTAPTMPRSVELSGVQIGIGQVGIRTDEATQIVVDDDVAFGSIPGTCATGIELKGTSSLVATRLISNTATTIVANDQSTVKIDGGQLSALIGRSCPPTPVIDERSSGSLTLTNSRLAVDSIGIELESPTTAPTVTLTDTDIIHGAVGLRGAAVAATVTGGEIMLMTDAGIDATGGTWNLDGVRVDHNPGIGIRVRGSGPASRASLTLRNALIYEQTGDGIYLSDYASADLGTVASPGRNQVSANAIGLDIDGIAGGEMVTAVGNIWNLSVQGTHGDGTYHTSAILSGPVAPVAGNNFAIRDGWMLELGP
jgi:hypothetical protein